MISKKRRANCENGNDVKKNLCGPHGHVLPGDYHQELIHGEGIISDNVKGGRFIGPSV